MATVNTTGVLEFLGREAMVRPSMGSSAAVAASLKKVRKGKGSLWSSLLLKYPGAVVMGLLSLAFCVVISLWQPLSPEQFARQWFENGGFLPQCNQALAFAKGASELRCYAKATLADRSTNRGLFGLNSYNSSHVSDECAYDCACSLRILSSLANDRLDREAFSRYINNTGVNIEALLGDAGPPCNTVAEGLILEGWSMLQIQGGRLAE